VIKLTLPLPPSVNKNWKPRRGGGFYLDPKVKEFREVVAEIAQLHGVKTIRGRFRSRLIFHPNLKVTDKRAWDANNREKALWDALEHAGVIENDKYDYDCHRIVGDPKPPLGLCVIEIEELR
jgi:crossover junction endodeoxyribonuclease RusA